MSSQKSSGSPSYEVNYVSPPRSSSSFNAKKKSSKRKNKRNYK